MVTNPLGYVGIEEKIDSFFLAAALLFSELDSLKIGEVDMKGAELCMYTLIWLIISRFFLSFFQVSKRRQHHKGSFRFIIIYHKLINVYCHALK